MWQCIYLSIGIDFLLRVVLDWLHKLCEDLRICYFYSCFVDKLDCGRRIRLDETKIKK